MNLKNINKNLQDINDIINSVDIGLLKNNDQHIHRKFHNIQKRLIINEIELSQKIDELRGLKFSNINREAKEKFSSKKMCQEYLTKYLNLIN